MKTKIKNPLAIIVKIAGVIWILCILGVVVITFIATDGFKGMVTDTKFGTSELFLILFIVLFLVGIVSFIIGVLAFVLNLNKREGVKKKRGVKGLIKFILTLVFLPFILLNQILKPLYIIQLVKKRKIKKLFSKKSLSPKALLVKAISLGLVLFILFPVWIGGFVVIAYLPASFLGFTTSTIPVRGYSMLPTISDGEAIEAYGFSKISVIFRKPQKGDLVVFKSGKAIKDGELVDYLKRIVAIPSDEILIKDGFVFINGQILDEPYTLKSRSTFGGTFLEECKALKMPEGYVFVLGDNRKRSEDSRDLGFVALNEVEYIQPFNKQDEYRVRWRDTSRDKELAGLPSFDFDAYYEQLNKVRQEKGLKPFRRNKKLEEAARRRAEAIIKFNELKIKPEESTYPSEKALREIGYSNIVTGEVFGAGYFDAEELTDYWLEFETKETVLNRDYQETGVAAVVGKINDCETQVIVQEFGGYVPPSYKEEDVESWESLILNLNSVIPSWESLRGNPKVSQDELNRLIYILYRRKEIARIVAAKMESQRWLSAEENRMIEEDKRLYEESVGLTSRLNQALR
jgi:signal peptidase I